MHADDIRRYVERYNRRLVEYGYDPRTLGWGGGCERQQLRFRIIHEIGVAAEDSVLDVGCGFADLFGYLNSVGWHGRYAGVDINSALLEEARRQHPGVDVRFHDVSHQPIDGTFDWVCASGVFNARLHHEDNLVHIERTITTMFNTAAKGVACDFMSTYVDFVHPDAYHADPADITRLARRLNWKIAIRMDYLPYEFMLYLLK
jgi:SAM-dependent methyltransferase